MFEHDRAFRAYLRAMRNSPGFWARLAAAAALVVAAMLRSDRLVTVVLLAGALVVVFPIGYLLWRRTESN